jgi:hypothetical protein
MAQLVASNKELERFLEFDSAREWSPGEVVDCCLSLAEWAVWLGYADPAKDYRGSYTKGQGQTDALERVGGALTVVGELAASINAEPLAEPQAGCIGVLGSATNATRQFGAIFDGRHWITRTSSGWQEVTARVLGIWKI